MGLFIGREDAISSVTGESGGFGGVPFRQTCAAGRPF